MQREQEEPDQGQAEQNDQSWKHDIPQSLRLPDGLSLPLLISDTDFNPLGIS
jgi:hypothetical protein